MSNTFDIKRFWLFFKRENVRAYNDMGVTTLILGLAPAIVFTIVEAFALILAGQMVDFGYFGVIGLFIALVIGCIIIPIKLYGPLTDKRFGSEWLMIPASRLEKFLTMMILCCVVAPAAILAINFATDGLLRLCIGGYYSGTIAKAFNFKDMADFMNQIMVPLGEEEIPVKMHMSIAGVTVLNWLEYIVFFLLGALIFRRSKFGLTLLCTWGLGTIFSMLGSVLLIAFDMEGALDALTATDPQKFVNIIAAVVYGMYAVLMLVPTYFIWRRVKNLKH